MARRRKTDRRGGFTAALLCAGAVALVAAPSAGLAFGGLGHHVVNAVANGGMLPFTPASVDARLARLMSAQSGKGLMQFTPVTSANRSGQSVTVAVRVDGSAAQLISVHSALVTAAEQVSASSAPLRLAPTRYNLGVLHGYQGFTQAQTPELSKSLSDAALPDLAVFKPSEGVKSKPSRFNARLAVDDQAHAGRTNNTLNDQTFDLGGSYRVTRNLNVTAGLRYAQERDQLAPLVTATGKQDSQAVYVGTQFRF